MRPLSLALLFATLNALAPETPLRVLRATPTAQTQPWTDIVITFDRPVAGSLEEMVPPERTFTITPAVPGRAEWRDPVSLRFEPTGPLTPGTTYTVTVLDNFTAMDGSKLEQPYTFRFTVDPPTVLTSEPVGPGKEPRFLPQLPAIRVLLSSQTNPQAFAASASIDIIAPCTAQRVPLNLIGMRRVNRQDSGEMRWSGIRSEADSARDLRRIIELRPARPLPLNCPGTLNLVQSVSPGAGVTRWPFSTYGPLTVTEVKCAIEKYCPTGPVKLRFSTPVRGAELARRLRVAPTIPFTIRDTAEENEDWLIDVELKPRQYYALVIDSLLTDVFGQKLRVQAVRPFQTTGFEPSVTHGIGKVLIERHAYRTLPVSIVNVDTIEVETIPIPVSEEAAFLAESWSWDEPLSKVQSLATTRKLAFNIKPDEPFLAGVQFAANDARVSPNGTLLAVRMRRPPDKNARPVNPNNPDQEQEEYEMRGIALIQVTDLGVHGRIGIDQGMVWVTGVRDGRPRSGALVRLHDAQGQVRAEARTDNQGLARLANFRPGSTQRECDYWCGDFEGYVSAQLNEDRAVVGIAAWDPDLSPWRFGINSAWSNRDRLPASGAVFVERGIYRPGERVYAKAVLRRGPLGALVAVRGDSLKWLFKDREGGTLRDTVVTVNQFGTAAESMMVPGEAPLGMYQVDISVKHENNWQSVASTTYQVAEYRPPEFLVEVSADQAARYGGDTVTVNVSGRYLFGAPMAGAPVRWVVQTRPVSVWELNIPGFDNWTWNIGESAWLDYDYYDYRSDDEVTVVQEDSDTLNARGSYNLRVVMPEPRRGAGSRTSIIAVVSDANRQTVAAGRSIVVHPAELYIAARNKGDSYFWRAGEPVTLEILAVRPNGERVSGTTVEGHVYRREWHRVRRNRNGQMEEVGSWVADTVANCRVVTAAQPASCTFTPRAGGSYIVSLSARDSRGRGAHTTFWNWAAGSDWVPWRDDSRLKIDVIADKKRYDIGDTATVLIASPFTNVEAWVTIERERVLESRRMRLTAGATTIKVPITEALAPNAFVSVLLVRGRTAEPGSTDDPGKPTMRVGYAELNVVPSAKKLTVDLSVGRDEYRPGDTATVRVAVKDSRGAGQRAEVTLWAVDEGVLSLTGYRTPDLLEMLYRPRGLGVRLASNLTAVASQIPPGMKGQRAPGGGGGDDLGSILRSRFQTTAFFLSSVVTDNNGNATARAKLPDNLTTFRVMAVAVTQGDRYGGGTSSILVSRPVVARPALPRFVREGDRFSAGVIVNQRMEGTRRVQVDATATGIALQGERRKTETLTGPGGREVRFDFTAQPGDSAGFQFVARSDQEVDAVAIKLPVKPSYHPLAQTIAGALRDTASAAFSFESEIDPARSRLEISFGTSTMSIIRGARSRLRIYPYYCTEQVSSTALPLIALYRVQKDLNWSTSERARATADIDLAIRMLIRRQRSDGGIGYWGSADWSSSWLTAYAGRVLLEAKAAGFAVDSMVLTRMGDYLSAALRQSATERFAVEYWIDRRGMELGERVAAADILSRLGRPDIPTENTLVSQLAQLRWEDRLRLAEMMARRGAVAPARAIMTLIWQSVRLEGRRAVLPSEAGTDDHYFPSQTRPISRLLTATMAVDPNHNLIGPMVETLVQYWRARGPYVHNTQDYGQTVLALQEFEKRRTQNAPARVTIRGPRGTILEQELGASVVRDTSFALTGLTTANAARFQLSVTNSSAPVYYFITVREVPRARPVRPVINGITVERWYEPVNSKTPITSIAAGELVRVRLRITVPDERHFVVLDDPLPAGLEAVDLSLRTISPFGDAAHLEGEQREERPYEDIGWYFGSWDSGMWSAFDHKEIRDDRVVYFATLLWKGRYTATYLARATTAGTFIVPPAHAEEMYNPAVNGRTGAGTFIVRMR